MIIFGHKHDSYIEKINGKFIVCCGEGEKGIGTKIEIEKNNNGIGKIAKIEFVNEKGSY
jgi:predicted phosphodiesterase